MPASAFTIMAHALAQEVATLGAGHIDVAECEQILSKVVDRTAAVASDRLPTMAAKPTPEESR